MNKPLKVNAKQTRSEASPELTRARPFLPRRLSQQSFCIFTSFRLRVIICHDVINIPLKGTRGARVLVASCVNRSCVGPSDHKAPTLGSSSAGGFRKGHGALRPLGQRRVNQVGDTEPHSRRDQERERRTLEASRREGNGAFPVASKADKGLGSPTGDK